MILVLSKAFQRGCAAQAFSKRLTAFGFLLASAGACPGFIPDASAQSKFFVTPGRGGGESAKGMAIIQLLLEENKLRKEETTENRGSIEALDLRVGTTEDDISDLQSEMEDIEPHAKEALSACAASGKVLHWDGGSWVCANEADPTVGVHSRATHTPPFCHETNAKLIWSVEGGGSWKCAADQKGDGSAYITSESDPTIQSVSGGRLCYGTGAKIACDSAAPTLNAGTLSVNSLAASGDITGAAAHFTGAVSGALPTATNHLATKAYVDSAVVAAGGGGGSASFPQCAITNSMYAGSDLGGLAGADLKCAAELGTGFRLASVGHMGHFAARTSNAQGLGLGWCGDYCMSGEAKGKRCDVRGTSTGLMNVTIFSSDYACTSAAPLLCCNF
ncbi:hypothetical protein [Oceanibaculum pacificum]|uniref:hypothetical protein n=1 Tax=Oceanibaculum pacificum TaxID=580166 RepID=UPI0018DE443D|nr:hypothetical protein [Oceanibaculum pacificum]